MSPRTLAAALCLCALNASIGASAETAQKVSVDGSTCSVPIPQNFAFDSLKPEGKQLVHRHLPIVAMSSCLAGEGPLAALLDEYKAPDYKILTRAPKLLVVEMQIGDVHNRSIIVGNSRWRQFTMIFKPSPEVDAEIARIQEELAILP